MLLCAYLQRITSTKYQYLKAVPERLKDLCEVVLGPKVGEHHNPAPVDQLLTSPLDDLVLLGGCLTQNFEACLHPSGDVVAFGLGHGPPGLRLRPAHAGESGGDDEAGLLVPLVEDAGGTLRITHDEPK